MKNLEKKFIFIGLIFNIFLALDVTSLEWVTQSDCKCTTTDGTQTIDLSPIVNSGKVPFFESISPYDNQKYAWQPCTTSGFNCQETSDVAVCQEWQEGGIKLGNPGTGKFSVDSQNRSILTLENAAEQRTATIILTCTSSGSSEWNILPETSVPPKYNYNMELKSSYACPKVTSTTPMSTKSFSSFTPPQTTSSPPSPNNDNGVIIISILLIVIILLLVICIVLLILIYLKRPNRQAEGNTTYVKF